MTRMSKTYFLLITFALVLILSLIRANIKTVVKVDHIDSVIKPIKIPIENLVKNYKQYHGKYIETSGKAHYFMEDFAIYASEKSHENGYQAFWIEENNQLNTNELHHKSANEKRIKIKGLVDTTNTGHLNAYRATIRDIYYLEY